MKHYYLSFAVLTAIIAASCGKTQSVETAPVNVHVEDFVVTVNTFTDTKAATDPASYDMVKAITLAFYEGDTQVYSATQLKSDPTSFTTFGEFSCDLPIGAYTLVVVARQVGTDDVFSLSSPTSAGYSSERPRETFCYSQYVTVTNTSPLDLSVTLNRIVSALNIVSTDGRPAGVTKVRTTYSKGSKSFNPSTGLALNDNGFTQVNNPSSAVDAPVNITSYVFLSSDEETMDITIEALNSSDVVLYSKTLHNVSFKRNRKTKAQGAIFSTSGSAGFQLETAWLEDNPVDL